MNNVIHGSAPIKVVQVSSKTGIVLCAEDYFGSVCVHIDAHGVCAALQDVTGSTHARPAECWPAQSARQTMIAADAALDEDCPGHDFDMVDLDRARWGHD